MPKTSAIRPAVSIEQRLLTRHRAIANTALAQCHEYKSRGQQSVGSKDTVITDGQTVVTF